jgi:nucleoside-diphosphate-sugar epimerase
LIVHAAAVTAVEAATERQMATRIAEVNIMGTVRLLDLAQQLQVRRMLYISSAGLYGTTAPYVRVTEDAPLQINGLYMIAKAASERLCRRYRELFNLDVIIGRLGQPYGPMERDTGVRSVMSPVYQTARGALEGRITRVPLPDYSCDWTYTLDLAEAVRLLVEAETLQRCVYNLSNGQARQLSDVVRHLKSLIPEARFEWVGSDEPADVDTRSDPRRGPLDVSRLCQEVNFESAYSLERGLEAALPWWREMIGVSA